MFPGAGGEALARESGVPFLGRVPFDPALAAAADRGEPYVAGAPEAPAARALTAIAASLRETLAAAGARDRPLLPALRRAAGLRARGRATAVAVARTAAGRIYANPVPACAAVVIVSGPVAAGPSRPAALRRHVGPAGRVSRGGRRAPRCAPPRAARRDRGGRPTRHVDRLCHDTYGPRRLHRADGRLPRPPTSLGSAPPTTSPEARWFRRSEIPYRRIAFPAVRRLMRRYLGGLR